MKTYYVQISIMMKSRYALISADSKDAAREKALADLPRIYSEVTGYDPTTCGVAVQVVREARPRDVEAVQREARLTAAFAGLLDA